MAAVNTAATGSLDAMYKKVYNDGIIFPLPEFSILQDLVPFKKAKRVGKSYISAIVVADEHGFTYGLADATMTLNDSIAATLQEIEVKGAQICGQASLNYDAASRSTSSEAAFMDAGHLVIQNLMTSHSKKLEASLLYGRKGIGTVSSLSSQDIILTAASWSDGLMMGAVGAVIDVYITGSTLRRGDLTVAAVNPDTYTLTVTGTTTDIVATDVLFFNGAVGTTMGTNDNECAGLDFIMTNTTTLFGVDAAAYPSWKAQSYSCGSAPITMSKVLSGAALAVSRGGLSEETVLLVHPSSWQNLNADQAALTVQNPENSSAKNGFDEIVYRGVSGKIKVKPHPAVKRGDAFLFAPKNLVRIGSQDIDNKTPGGGDDIFFHSATLSAYTIRSYSNQAIFAEKPSQMVKFTAIVPA
jgi:hypothetical protein